MTDNVKACLDAISSCIDNHVGIATVEARSVGRYVVEDAFAAIDTIKTVFGIFGIEDHNTLFAVGDVVSIRCFTGCLCLCLVDSLRLV